MCHRQIRWPPLFSREVADHRFPHGTTVSIIQACLVIITEPVTLPEPKLLPPATAPVANGRKDAMVLLETGATDSVLPNTKLRSGQRWPVAGLAVPPWTCIYL